jgi:hypothetical protein
MTSTQSVIRARAAPGGVAGGGRRLGLALLVIATAQLMVVLDNNVMKAPVKQAARRPSSASCSSASAPGTSPTWPRRPAAAMFISRSPRRCPGASCVTSPGRSRFRQWVTGTDCAAADPERARRWGRRAIPIRQLLAAIGQAAMVSGSSVGVPVVPGKLWSDIPALH